MYIGDVGIEEPMWVYLSFMRRAQREEWFIEHPIGIREITGLTLTSPVPLRSPVAQRIVEVGPCPQVLEHGELRRIGIGQHQYSVLHGNPTVPL
jgi:hypothetical protein